MLKWILIAVGALMALAVVGYVTGLLLPRKHVARMTGIVANPPPEVAAVIRNVRGYANWRAGVVIQDVVETPDATTYVELKDGDRIAYVLREPVRDQRFTVTITDPALPFGGSWTIALAPEGSGTRVSIQEDGEIRDPIYRLFAHFVFGYTSSMTEYLESLGATQVHEGQ